tara:strand:- start:5727 stop:7052 length:1326 start_codon:yes stop_codon:yes gene_type:complete
LKKNSNKCDVMILAGGFGTRLSKVYHDIPKPLLPVGKQPLIEYQINQCKTYGFKKILILVHHKANQIIDFLGDGKKYNLEFEFVREDVPLGTGGAMINSLHLMNENFLVIYGDTFFKIDLNFFYEFHLKHRADSTVFLHPNDHPYDSDLVKIDKNDYVEKIFSYPHKESLLTRNLVNAAMYFFNKKKLNYVKLKRKKFDIAKDFLPKMLQNKMKIKGYVSQEYIKDAGTPDRIIKVNNHIKNNLHNKLSLAGLRKAVFIDRDGTINKEVDHLNDLSKFKLIENSAKGISLLNQNGYLAIVITNQPVIARGELSFEGLDNIHSKMEKVLSYNNAYVDKIYFCPHHPDSGFDGEVKELKINCNCRKPKTELFEKSIKDLKIDVKSSWMIGDRTSDILAGKRSSLNTILVKTGYFGSDNKYDVKPDFIMDDLYSAIKFIIENDN